VIVVHHVFRPDTGFQVLEVGSQMPAHASALGKAMLAYAPAEVIDGLTSEPLPRLTQRTLTAAALRAQLAEVREQGIARERDEAVIGESSVAAPITDHSGEAVGAIGVVGDTARLLPRGPAKATVAAVTEAARAISRELGAARWPG
jgi:DNA-binding IclR family transcriptional regulator